MKESKYIPLQKHLLALKQSSWTASFSEIESILGFRMPQSAYDYAAWWGNNVQNSRHTRTWLDIGWRTEDLDLGSQVVTFNRIK